MRNLSWPGYQFWYHVSLFGLFLIPYSYYRLITEFAEKRERRVEIVYLILLVIVFSVNLPNGFLLAPPDIVENGTDLLFVYRMNWHVYILVLISFLVVGHLFYILFQCVRETEHMREQFRPIFLGMCIVALGQLLILLPQFEGIPVDIVSGVINAGLIFYTLTKVRLVKLRLTESENICYELGLLIAYVLIINFNPRLRAFIEKAIPGAPRFYDAFIITLFFFLVIFFVFVWKILIKYIFVKKEIQQAEYIQEFSSIASKSLKSQDIMHAMIDMIKKLTDVEAVYICDKTMEFYQIKYSDQDLEHIPLFINADDPLIAALKKTEEGIIFRRNYDNEELLLADEEIKELLQKLQITAALGLRNGEDMRSVIFLGPPNRKRKLDKNHLSMISSVGSVAVIALKNASLYEKAYYEARTDELTGLYNRKYFQEILDEQFELHKDSQMALVMLNIDDFKLFNQLYGTLQGDETLRRIAEIIRRDVGKKGYVARFTGKEFAILLPKYDVYEARKMTMLICEEIRNLNQENETIKLKSLTVSAGISTTPYAAKSVKELLENVDIAVYHVKRNGKNGIQVFDTIDEAERKENRRQNHKQEVYQEYESTIYALTAAIDAKDHYTFAHSKNVAYYATELAKQLNLNEDMIEMIRQAALLHDVGKISISESILGKPSELTAEEYETMKGHVEASINIIRHLPSLDYVIPAVIGHHERYDGKGYPRRISGEDIPLTARILCLADSFDAMTSKRVYKSAIPTEKALEIVRMEAGKQFDPELVSVFIKCIEEKKIHVVAK